ncbi:MAG: PCRF domain-containing protein, partial [Acetobacter orientalis]
MTLDERLDRIVSRSLELEALLASGISGEAFTQASREYAEIEPVVAHINALRHAEQEAAQAELLLADPEMKELAEGELADIRERLPELSQNVRLAMLPRDAADERSAILEIRPAAGGDEAALFAAELFDLYRRYADLRGWRFSIMDY